MGRLGGRGQCEEDLWLRGEGMEPLCACTQLSIMIPEMCQGIIPWASSHSPACPISAAKVGTRMPAAEGERRGPDLPVH